MSPDDLGHDLGHDLGRVEELEMPTVGPAVPLLGGKADDRYDGASLRADEDRRRRLRPWAIVFAAAVVIVTGGVSLSYTPLFGARMVEVEGEERLGPRQVLRAGRIGIGTNVVHLDETATEARLEAEPWILEATVESVLPGTIRISVTERTPVLVMEDGGARRIVAGDGTVLGRASRLVALPEVVASPGTTLDTDVIRSAGEVVHAMTSALRARVDTVSVAPDQSVTLVVDGEIDVRYGPVAEAIAKAQALSAILEFAHDEGRSLLSIDVSAPAAPTARFVDSPMPISAPDPSADVDVPDAGSPAGPGEDDDPSPSASV